MLEEPGWILGFHKFLKWTLREGKIKQRECTGIHLLKCKHKREYLLRSVCPTTDQSKIWCPVTAMCHFIQILPMTTRHIRVIFTVSRDFQCHTAFMSNVKFPSRTFSFPFSPNFPSDLWGLKSLILILTLLQLLHTLTSTSSLPNHSTQNLSKRSSLVHHLSNQQLQTNTQTSQNHWHF